MAHQLLAADDDGARQRSAAKLTVSLLLGMIVMMFSLFLYAEDIYDPAVAPLLIWLRTVYGWAAFALATPVMMLLGVPLARRALRALRHGSLTMELLIASAVGSAYLFSVVALAQGSTEIYFDSAVAALLLATFGRYLEAVARSHASLRVGHLLDVGSAPVWAGTGDLQKRSPRDVEVGMRVEVAADQAVPVDLVAVRSAEVSLAVITGESESTSVRPGDEVPAGAIVRSTTLAGIALRTASDSTVERLAELTRSLREGRSPLLKAADRMARWLTPIVFAVALGAFIFWARSSLRMGVEAALAVTLVACPCTYGVITPLISWLSMKKALEHGVCIRDATALEHMARVRTVIFDKTGTLTEPKSDVRVTYFGDGVEERVAGWVSALECDVVHPIARQLRAWASTFPSLRGIAERKVHRRGVTAVTETGQALTLGEPSWLVRRGIAEAEGRPDYTALLALGEQVVAGFALSEQLRPEAAEATSNLHEQGYRTWILSGDRSGRVSAVADLLSIDRALGDLSPADKVLELGSTSNAALVGDGANDAPAAAAATVGFAVAGAATLHRGVADVALLRDDLMLVPWSLGLARRGTRLVQWSLALATIYNVFFIALAASGMLRPLWAGLSMILASLLALSGAIRIAQHQAPESAIERPHPTVAVA